jgi:hypothetical protein
MWPIDKVNGKPFKDFKEFFQRMENLKEPYYLLEDNDGIKVIIDREEAQKRQQEILRKYNIEYDKSEDLREHHRTAP